MLLHLNLYYNNFIQRSLVILTMKPAFSMLALALGIFCAPVFAQIQIIPPNIPAYDYQTADQVIQTIYSQDARAQDKNINTRIEAISRYFLGKPYLLGALGEGKQGYYDQSPLYRTDAFDCMTFVSTVLALAECANLQQFQCTIRKVNYRGGKLSFANRNHFMELDWNPQNTNQGYIKDITSSIHNKKGRPIALWAHNVINKATWFRQLPADRLKFYQPVSSSQWAERLAHLHEEGHPYSIQHTQIPYIPLSQLFDIHGRPNTYLFRQIPAGAIIELIRPNWPSRYQYVSHVGLTVIEHGELLFREASSHEQRVVDVPLARYLATYFPLNAWNGINIQKIIPQGNTFSSCAKGSL